MENNFEVFIITYTESNADSNFRQIQTRIFNQIQRIDNVKGTAEAYEAVLKKASKDYVYIVEGDNYVNTDFKFVDGTDQSVHIWPCINRSNQSVWYNSGVKLFPVKPYKNHKFNKIDVLLDVPTDIVWEETPISVHQYDNTDFHAFSHIVKQNLRLRLMIESGLEDAKKEYNKWTEWDLHSPYRVALFQASWNFAETLDIENLDENLFNNYDKLKEYFIPVYSSLPQDELDDGNNINPFAG